MVVLGFVVYALLVALSFAGILVGVGSLLIGFDRFREERAIRTTPLSSLDSVALGPVAVSGTVEPIGSTIPTMYGCDECVAYEVRVVDSGSDGSDARIDRSAVVPFDVATDQGSIRLRESCFEIHASDERSWNDDRESYEQPERAVWEFERAWGIDDLRAGDDRDYEAAYLCPGDEVYAYGTAELDETRDGSGKPLVLTDRDGLCFLSDEDPATLRQERRWALAKNVAIGVPVATASLAAFLWLTGFAQIFLGA